ncbi:MAG: Rad52/Rad22 family DNA repair protein [Isosphaeraceae bacterium]
MDQHLELFAALAASFEHDEVRLRPQAGRQLPYITARTVMNRLDDVLGPANWWDEYSPQQNSVICRLTIRLPDGTTLTKCDAGGYAGMSDSGDDDKSGFSDAFKRAAVKFGIGRYLYRDGLPRFVKEFAPHPSASASTPPAPQKPADSPQPARPPQPTASSPSPVYKHDHGHDHGPPQTGKALFAWIKHHDEANGTELLEKLSEWARRQDFPARMIHWNADQVQRGFALVQTLVDDSRAGPEQSPARDRPATGSTPASSSRGERASPPNRSGRGR